MMVQEELHIGISIEDYLNNKKAVLEIKTILFELYQQERRIKLVREQQVAISKAIVKAHEILNSKLNKLKKELPHIRMPKTHEIEPHAVKHVDVASPEDQNPVMDELQRIQEKLDELNRVA